MVFDHEPDGPHHIDHERTARDNYGRHKIAGEDAITAANPQAMIARIGWQIDPTQPGNNMLTALDDWQRREDRVAASRAGTPACSFIADMAAALLSLIDQPHAGAHHLDSNAQEAWRFDELALALADCFERGWQVQAHEDYRHDQRLIGGTLQLPGLSSRLSAMRRRH
ncbi:hypothetical protein AT984_18300 [Paucibacter sp. KCTC 42545]|nr:hypothetical protein AT984_18300 [Paucibacter sp. KCTC 42545]